MESMRLADGRRLAWHEFGDPTGAACLYTTGTPASGLAGSIYEKAAREVGVRFLSVDKPGYGHSDFMPERRLTDWPGDIAAMADHLGLERFAVMGESGGGPHALALAWGLPERVTVTLLVSGMGPGHEPWVREGMKPMNRRLFWLAQRAPFLLNMAMRSMARTLGDETRREKWIKRQLAAAPPADRALMERHPELMQLSLDAALDAFRQGPQGATQEMGLFAKPWGFALSEIRSRVHLWHGTEDVNVPIAVARRLGEELPSVVEHIIEGGGHALGVEHGETMLGQVLEAS